MADGLTFDVVGNRVIADNLDVFGDEAMARIAEAMQAAAEVGEQVMKERSRVRTGEMRDSTYAEVRDGQIVFGDDSDHAIYNELGTHKMSAQPFIVPGALAGGDELKKLLGGNLF